MIFFDFGLSDIASINQNEIEQNGFHCIYFNFCLTITSYIYDKSYCWSDLFEANFDHSVMCNLSFGL